MNDANTEKRLLAVQAAADADRSQKESARQAAVAAIQALERAVSESLQGKRLGGLPNLGTPDDPVRAVNVRGASPDKRLSVPSGREPDTKFRLCIDRSGELVMIRIGWRDIETRKVASTELFAGDLPCVVNAYRFAIGCHLTQLGENIERYARLEALSMRVGEAIDAWGADSAGGTQ